MTHRGASPSAQSHLTFGTCQLSNALVLSIPMQPEIRKDSYRRSRALFSPRLASLVGLFGLGCGHLTAWARTRWMSRSGISVGLVRALDELDWYLSGIVGRIACWF